MEISRRHLVGREMDEYLTAMRGGHESALDAASQAVESQFPGLPAEVLEQLRSDVREAAQREEAQRERRLREQMEGMTRNQRRVFMKRMKKARK